MMTRFVYTVMTFTFVLAFGGSAFGQWILLDDHFDNGDPATGGTNGGFLKKTNTTGGNGAISESGTDISISTTGGANDNTGIFSINSFDVTGDPASGFIVTWVVTNAEDPQANGINLIIAGDSAGWRPWPRLSFRFDKNNDQTLRLIGFDNTDTEHEYATDPFTMSELTDGFTVTATLNSAGWSYSFTGLDSIADNSGTWTTGWEYGDLFDSTTHVGAYIQKASTDRTLTVDRITVESPVAPPATLVVAPTPPLVITGIAPAGDTPGTFTLTNGSPFTDLIVTDVSETADPSGRFTVIGAPLSGTVTPAGGSTPTMAVVVSFNATGLTEADSPVTGAVTVTSNHGGVPGATEMLAIEGRIIESQDYVWGETGTANENTTGTWTETTKWSPVGAPRREDTVTIESGELTLGHTGHFVIDPTTPNRDDGITSLVVTSGSLIVNLTAAADQFRIGENPGGYGELIQSGGSTITINGYVNTSVDGPSYVSITDSTFRIAEAGRWMRIGNRARGVLDFNGGLIETTQDVYLSYESGGDGVVNMTDGVFRPGANLIIGQGDRGEFNLSGGVLEPGGDLRIGNNAGSSGTLNLSGGAITITGADEFILAANVGRAIFNMTGGSIDTPLLRQGGGAILGFNWSGGRISADRISMVMELVSSGGILSPGLAAGVGTTEFDATNYSQSSTSTLEITIDGASADRVQLTNGAQATLDGNLNVNIVSPPSGAGLVEYTIVDGAYTGAFAADNLPNWLALVYRVGSVVLEPNRAPVVTAGATTTSLRLADASDTVTLVLLGSATDAYPGGPLVTTWTLVSAPTSGSATIVDPSALNTTVTLGGGVGTYIFELAAADSLGALGIDTVNIQVFDLSNLPPIVNAGLDLVVGAVFVNTIDVTLSGSVSDPESQPTTASWSVVATPGGGSGTFQDSTSTATIVTLSNIPGDYRLKLSGSDGDFVVSDEIVITVIQDSPTAVRTRWELME